jgi:hypothetical protein
MIELATTTEQPKMTKSAQIRNYVAKHPKAKSADVAKVVGVTPAYVATVMWTAKKKAKVAKKAKPTLTLQREGAPRKGVTLDMLKATNKALEKENKIRKAMAEHKKMFDDTLNGWKTLSTTTSNTPMQVEMFEPKPDPVNNPAHYTVGGIETIDFIEAKKLGYNLGNVVKYLTRADHKGNKLEDLRKAQWYLTREINSLK